MDINEIINRDIQEEFHIEEYCFVLEHYIFRRKGVNVHIDRNQFTISPFSVLAIQNCFDKASKWLKENDSTEKKDL